MFPPTIRTAPTSEKLLPRAVATAREMPLRASPSTARRACHGLAPRLRTWRISSGGTAPTEATVIPTTKGSASLAYRVNSRHRGAGGEGSTSGIHRFLPVPVHPEDPTGQVERDRRLVYPRRQVPLELIAEPQARTPSPGTAWCSQRRRLRPP